MVLSNGTRVIVRLVYNAHVAELGRVFTSNVSSPNLARQRKNMPV